MASAAVRLATTDVSSNKERLSCWPTHRGEPYDMAHGEFPDDFVTFNASDFVDGFESPSTLLDRLDDTSTGSSFQNQKTFFESQTLWSPGDGPSHIDLGTSAIPHDLHEQATIESADTSQRQKMISDAELLRLEGMTSRSSSLCTNTVSSSPSMSQRLSPPKRTHSVEPQCVTLRRVTHRPKYTQTQPQIGAKACRKKLTKSWHPPQGLHGDGDGFNLTKHESTPNIGIPLSSPLVGDRSSSRQPNPNEPKFVTGIVEDAFTNSQLLLPPSKPYNSVAGPSTPVNDPNPNVHTFFTCEGYHAIGTNSAKPQQIVAQQQRGMSSSADWPMEGIITDPISVSQNSSEQLQLFDSDNSLWWNQIIADFKHTPASMSNTPNSIRNDVMYGEQAARPYDCHNPEMLEPIIHMPQPRAPQAAVLDECSPEHRTLATPTHHSYAVQPHVGHFSERGAGGPYTGEYGHTRPLPQTPTSSSWHRGSLTSPRKLQRSGSRRMLCSHRDESASPTPSRRCSSSSVSVRKQRSWSAQHRDPKREAGTPPLLLYPDQHNSGIAGEGRGFVNFTPDDKTLLMTGVAPSGSSKTKARREKEALEKRRRLSEAALKAVQAAGGDVEALVKQGFDV